MDLFCNDKYWNKIEGKNEKTDNQILKTEARKLNKNVKEESLEDLIKQWGDHDFRFKLEAQGGLGQPNDPI